MILLRNPYTHQRQVVLSLDKEGIENLARIEPDIDQKLSWRDFWEACTQEQKRFCEALLQRKLSMLGYRKTRTGRRRMKELKEEIKSLILQYVIM